MTEALLEIRGLVKRFGGLTATDHADLRVERGEVHALIGPNGAGKTTLVAQISGTLRPDGGSIRFDGADITRTSMHARVAAGLARSYQITSIFRRCTAIENVTLALQARGGAELGFWRPVAAEAWLFREAAGILEQVGLSSQADALAGELAHGEQRRLEVALALATRPRLLLLDEPMAGLGPEESRRMVELLLRLKAQATLLLVEHDMDAVFQLADRISTLVFGKVIATGTPEEIRAHPEVRKAYLGAEALP
jgi:branched-chain amino acid transport system ATP-binding protein